MHISLECETQESARNLNKFDYTNLKHTCVGIG